MDICYTRPKEEMRNKEEKSKPILVMKDKDTKFMISFMLKSKGQDPYTIRTVCRYIERVIGHKKLIIRSDQEPAM